MNDTHVKSQAVLAADVFTRVWSDCGDAWRIVAWAADCSERSLSALDVMVEERVSDYH